MSAEGGIAKEPGNLFKHLKNLNTTHSFVADDNLALELSCKYGRMKKSNGFRSITSSKLLKARKRLVQRLNQRDCSPYGTRQRLCFKYALPFVDFSIENANLNKHL